MAMEKYIMLETFENTKVSSSFPVIKLDYSDFFFDNAEFRETHTWYLLIL